MDKLLDEKVVLITGASKGVGKGVALGLGERGATIYITGRNEKNLNNTAGEVRAVGGKCFPIVCDHTDDSQVEQVFKKISSQGHKISILVNSVWGGYETMIENGEFTWEKPFWEQSNQRWESMFNAGVRAAFISSKIGVKDMIETSDGLIVNISFWSAQKHLGNIIYGTAKAATDKLSQDMAHEVKNLGVCVVSLYPGLVRTEAVMANAEYLDLTNSESPQFIGRVIAGLYLDNNKIDKTGKILVAAYLAKEYEITDIDGKCPNPLSINDV